MDSSTLATRARDAFERSSFDGEEFRFDGGTAVDFDPTAFRIITPQIGGPRGMVVVHVGGARWGLPRGVRIAPAGRNLLVMSESGRIHLLAAVDGEVRELQGPVAWEHRARCEAFDRP